MKALSLKTTSRETVGKGHARSLRKKGLIPAILYGPNLKATNLSVVSAEFQKILKTSKTSQFLLDLTVNGSNKKVTVKELQKHLISGEILHIDFYEVAMGRKIKVSVPISTVGICKGVELGGMLQIVRREIEILCLPDNIPESISIDVSDLDIGNSFHVSDLSLPDEIELHTEDNFTILTVLSQKSTLEEEESSEEEVDGTEDDSDDSVQV